MQNLQNMQIIMLKICWKYAENKLQICWIIYTKYAENAENAENMQKIGRRYAIKYVKNMQ